MNGKETTSVKKIKLPETKDKVIKVSNDVESETKIYNVSSVNTCLVELFDKPPQAERVQISVTFLR